ncbi:MAG: SprT family zinc-dependent metalloprotease [Patescibacteria group bacterium]
MPHQITLNGKIIDFTIKKNRLSRRVRILIHADGRVVVSAPRFVTQKYIKQFVLDKSEWILNTLAKCKPENANKKTISKNDFHKNKLLALKIVREKIRHFGEIYNLRPQKIYIRNQTTRWGSCSGHGNLSFNFRLVYLPVSLLDYLIVHELCHLQEMNHSSRFWAIVAKTIPDYKKRKTALREASRHLL